MYNIIKKSFFSLIIVACLVFVQNLLYFFFYNYLSANTSYNLNIIDLLTYSTASVLIVIFLLLTKKKPKPTNKVKISFKYLANTVLLIFAIYILFDPLFSRNLNTDNNSTILTGLINFLIFVIIPPLNEELIFRKSILRMFEARKKDVYIGILISSILFTLAHIDFYFEQNYKYLLTIFILGLIFGIIYFKYGLIYSIISHSLYSFFIFLNTKSDVNINIVSYINNNVLSWIIYGSICIAFIYLLAKILKPTTESSKQ